MWVVVWVGVVWLARGNVNYAGVPGRRTLPCRWRRQRRVRVHSFVCSSSSNRERKKSRFVKGKGARTRRNAGFSLTFNAPFLLLAMLIFCCFRQVCTSRQTPLERLLQNYYVMCAFTCVYPPSVLNAPCPGPPSSAGPHSLHRPSPNPPC